jgi:Cu/Ag efflux protein CusF
MIRPLSILALFSMLSVNAFAAEPATPPSSPPTTATPPSSQAPVHTMGTVSKIDTASKSITITTSEGKPETYSLGTTTLEKTITVGAKVDVAHAPNSMTATSVTIQK